MNNRLCITTYVSGEEYQEFIPVFIYSALKSYPDLSIIIFCGENLQKNVKDSLALLNGFGDFKVIENHLSFSTSSLSKRVASMSKRWLLFIDEFQKYENIYIGDIDIFIIPEKPSLLNQHLTHCKTIGLAYSNIVRRSHYNRISGLHFVKQKPYFSKMLPVIGKYLELMKNNELVYEYSCEYMLYDMISEAGLGICPRADGKDTGNPEMATFRPDHGVHLAIFRDLIVKKRRVSDDIIINKISAMKQMINNPFFEKIEKNIKSKKVKKIFKRIHYFKI